MQSHFLKSISLTWRSSVFRRTTWRAGGSYFAEIFTNAEIQIPIKYNLPEKAEDWVNFALPEAFMQKANGHEDKIMIAKWTFIKPELTLAHL